MKIESFITFTLDDVKNILKEYVEKQGYKVIGTVDVPAIVPKDLHICIDIENNPVNIGKGGQISA